jgi:hypothetical protein
VLVEVPGLVVAAVPVVSSPPHATSESAAVKRSKVTVRIDLPPEGMRAEGMRARGAAGRPASVGLSYAGCIEP